MALEPSSVEVALTENAVLSVAWVDSFMYIQSRFDI